MTSDANSFFRIGRDGVTAEMRRCWACVEETRCGVVDSLSTATKRSHEQIGSEMLPQLLVGRRMNVENRWDVDSWSAFRGLLCVVTAKEPVLHGLIKTHVLKLSISFLAARWRCVTRADLRKYGATVGCAVCSGIVVHGQRAKPHTDECRARIGKHMEHEPQGHERLQDERNGGEMWTLRLERPLAPVVRENAGDRAPLEEYDVAVATAVPCESTTVNRGAEAVDERACSLEAQV